MSRPKLSVDSNQAAIVQVAVDVTPFPDTNPTVGRKLPAGELLKLVTLVATLLPDCVSSDPKSRSNVVFTPLIVELIEPASCVNALLKICAPTVPIELVAAVVVLLAVVVVEGELVVLPSLLGEALTLLTPPLEAVV